MISEEDRSQVIRMKSTIESALRSSGFYTMCDQAVIDHKNFFVSGGCFTSMLNDEKPKDFDLYSINPAHGILFKLWIEENAMYRVEDINPAYGGTLVEGKLITSNAITLKNGVQFITRDMGPANNIRNTFDFEHCMPYYHLGEGMIYMSELQHHLCKNKLLLKRKVDSGEDRTPKFLARGFKIYGS